MISTFNKSMTISAGQITQGIRAFEKYQNDFTNPDLQLELVTIYVTDKPDVIKLKNEEYLQEQKDKVYSELDSDTYDEVLDFFPLVVARKWLKSLGLSQEQVEERMSAATKLAEQQRQMLLAGLLESSQPTQEV